MTMDPKDRDDLQPTPPQEGHPKEGDPGDDDRDDLVAAGDTGDADEGDAGGLYEDDGDEHEIDEHEIDEGGLDEEDQPAPLDLDVTVERRSTCERHVTVRVPREEIERYFDREFSELVPQAQVPGFRPGRAPRKLVEARFRKDIGQKVKLALISEAITQVSEEEDLTPIGEPDLDLEAVALPDDGPLTFEYDLEVRPDFDLPQWKGLSLERPVYQFTAADVDRHLERLLAEHGRLVPFDGPVSAGDYVVVNLAIYSDGKKLSSSEEEVLRLRPVLSFRDGRIDRFDEQMEGARAGETRELPVQIGAEFADALAGREIVARFEVLEVKKLELPQITPALLAKLGDFESEADLRDAILDSLQRQLEYSQQRRIREQITDALVEAATWDLPPTLLARQSERELVRAKMELERSGFTPEEIRAQENYIRQNSHLATARALKEHFILERIAELEEIEVHDTDIEDEVRLLARQRNESPRRVRAQLEKMGALDILHNQVLERKVVQRIVSEASFRDVPFSPEQPEAATIDQSLSGQRETTIPVAKPEGSPAGPDANA